MTKSNFAFLLGLAIPALFVFKSLILPGPAVWGDAPYFFPQALRELTSGPYAWSSFGNNFGATNSFLWIYPLMFLYGLLHSLFGLNNDVIIRLLFYIPAVMFSFGGPVLFARYLGFSRIVQFFASLIYALNTYFLLVVDGGQIGVALAYGLFPLALLHLRKLAVRPSFIQFFGSLAIFSLLMVGDVRFAVIAVFTLALWLFVDYLVVRRYEAKGMRFLFLFALTTIALSLYWLIPMSRLGTGTLSADVSKLQLLSLLNSLFLFQPHWPLNEFGKVFPPPFYFTGIPLLVFGGLFWIKDKKIWSIALLVLIFAFLVKGETSPLGGIYSWVVNLPFGLAFRDSTKFFAPLLLFAGVLVGTTGETIGKLLKNNPTLLRSGVGLLGYLYLLFLVHPAMLGNLNGVLAGREFPRDFEAIHQELATEENFSRTAWFPERSPFAFHIERKPALDAKYLVDERPFASINVGTFDAFNFLHNDQYLDWFDLLGIKYLVFSGDPRKVSLNQEEREDWDTLLNLAAGKNELEKVDWGTTFPIYKVPTTKPHIFGVSKLVVVVGGDGIYQEIKDVNSNFSIGNQGFVFFEDGKFNPLSLQGLPKDSAILAFVSKNETDLAMSFLQEYFVSPSESLTSEWAVRNPDDYLRYKYEFLIKGVDIKEFDYSEGIAFSSVRGEKISWNLPIPYSGDYVLAVRTLSNESIYSWDISDIYLERGVYPLILTNDTDFKVVNVVALIPKEAWDKAEELARNFTGKFEVVRLDEPSGIERLISLTEDVKWQKVQHEMVSPAHYRATVPESAHWIVFTDTYDAEWKLTKGAEVAESIPFYSMVNGFYVKSSEDIEIVFEGQKRVNQGIFISGVSLLSLAVIFLWFYSKRKGKKV